MKYFYNYDTIKKKKKNDKKITYFIYILFIFYFIIIDIASINDTQYSKSSIVVFQFGHPDPIMIYTTNDTSKILKCSFDCYGQKFGACTGNGDLYLWNFDNAQTSSEPCQVITNNHSPINDFRFLSSSSLIATALSSSNNE